VAISELLGDQVAALELVGRLLRAHGRVLPMSVVPLDIEAEVTMTSPSSTIAAISASVTGSRCTAAARAPPR